MWREEILFGEENLKKKKHQPDVSPQDLVSSDLGITRGSPYHQGCFEASVPQRHRRQLRHGGGGVGDVAHVEQILVGLRSV